MRTVVAPPPGWERCARSVREFKPAEYNVPSSGSGRAMGTARQPSAGPRVGYHRRIASRIPRTIMNSHLPYRATTANGETIDVTFDLHAETRSEADVVAMLTVLLEAIDARVASREGVSNGDVLQALAMASALRVAMIPAPRTVTEPLARDLLDTALACASFAQRVPAVQPAASPAGNPVVPPAAQQP